jgi:hypothetical protein
MTEILLKEPNKDIEDLIDNIENRSHKMLTVLVVLAGLIIYSKGSKKNSIWRKIHPHSN